MQTPEGRWLHGTKSPVTAHILKSRGSKYWSYPLLSKQSCNHPKQHVGSSQRQENRVSEIPKVSIATGLQMPLLHGSEYQFTRYTCRLAERIVFIRKPTNMNEIVSMRVLWRICLGNDEMLVDPDQAELYILKQQISSKSWAHSIICATKYINIYKHLAQGSMFWTIILHITSN